MQFLHVQKNRMSTTWPFGKNSITLFQVWASKLSHFKPNLDPTKLTHTGHRNKSNIDTTFGTQAWCTTLARKQYKHSIPHMVLCNLLSCIMMLHKLCAVAEAGNYFFLKKLGSKMNILLVIQLVAPKKLQVLHEPRPHY
jgi:hypothetical protein